MRACLVLLLVVLLTGCGSGRKSNGEAAKSAAQVVTDMQHAALGARSAHVAGRISSKTERLKLDVTLEGQRAKGSLVVFGSHVDFVRDGNTLYARADESFYKAYAPNYQSRGLAGKWVKAPTAGVFLYIANFASPQSLFAQLIATRGELVNKGETQYRGQPTVEILDKSDQSKLYVAATGKPYPVEIVGGSKERGAISFDRWNASVHISPPAHAIDLGGGSG